MWVLNAVLEISSVASSVEAIFPLAAVSTKSIIFGKGYASLCVCVCGLV